MAPERLFVSLNRVILVTVRGPLLSPLRAVANLLVNSCAAGTGNNAVPAAASPPGSRSPAAPREEASRPGSRSSKPARPGGTGRRVPPEAGSGHTASLPPATSTVPASKGAGVSTEYTAPALVVAESASRKLVAGASSANSRFPRPTATGKTSSRYSSIRPARCSDPASAQLPCTCSSPPGRFFTLATSSRPLPDSTVVACHFGSRRVRDTTYFGWALSVTAAVLPGSVTCDQ